MRLLTDVEVKRDRDGQGTSFAEIHVSDEGTHKTIDVYKIIRKTSPSRELGMWGVEIYQGPNYVKPWDSKDRSYSRHYPRGKGLPDKYKPIVAQLKKALGGTFTQV